MKKKILRFNSQFIENHPWLKYLAVAFSTLTIAWMPALVNRNIGASSPLALWQKIKNFRQAKPSLAVRVEEACRAINPGATLLRTLAEEAAKEQPTLARDCYHKLMSLNAATEIDRCAHAALLAQLHDFNGARAVLGGKPGPMASLTPEVRTTWIKIWTESGDFVSAAGALDSVMSCGPDEVKLALSTARAASAARAPADVISRLELRCVNMLQAALLGGAEPEIQDLIRQMLSLPLAGVRERAEAVALLEKLKYPTVVQRLGQARLKLPAHDSNGEDGVLGSLRDVIASAGALTVTQKREVAAFLLQQGEHQLVLETIPLQESRTDRVLFSQRVDAALTLGDWREAGRMSAGYSAPSVPWARSLLHAASTLQEPGEAPLMAEPLVNSAITEASMEKRWSSAFTAGRMALDNRLQGLASRAFEMALRIASDKAKTLEKITLAARTSEAPLSVVRLAAHEALRDSDDAEVKVQLAYLDLLAGMRPELPERDVTALQSFVRALHQYQGGDVSSAVRTILALPRHRWHQSQAAVMAGILAAAGQHDSSKALLEKVDTRNLFAEERAIVEPWQVGHQLGLGITMNPLVGYQEEAGQ